ncbi:unnamed protein product [Amoebophrya sp. A120]|nr:unnamed protein product [Amoebophrya sp. A120]|eukprot:GSA120T00009722001.1
MDRYLSGGMTTAVTPPVVLDDALSSNQKNPYTGTSSSSSSSSSSRIRNTNSTPRPASAKAADFYCVEYEIGSNCYGGKVFAVSAKEQDDGSNAVVTAAGCKRFILKTVPFTIASPAKTVREQLHLPEKINEKPVDLLEEAGGSSSSTSRSTATGTTPRDGGQHPQGHCASQNIKLHDPHPHLVTLIEKFENKLQRQHEYIYEDCEGGELSDFIHKLTSKSKNNNCLHEQTCALYVRQLLQAVAALRSSSLPGEEQGEGSSSHEDSYSTSVHGLISPSTVLLTSKLPDAVVKLADLGLGRRLVVKPDDQHLHPHTGPTYAAERNTTSIVKANFTHEEFTCLSPQQRELMRVYGGGPSDLVKEIPHQPEDDVWGIGMVAYFMLAGRLPVNYFTEMNNDNSDKLVDFDNMYMFGQEREPPVYDPSASRTNNIPEVVVVDYSRWPKAGPRFYADDPVENWEHRTMTSRDFLRKMLEPDPKKRLTIAEALNHEWIFEKGREYFNPSMVVGGPSTSAAAGEKKNKQLQNINFAKLRAMSFASYRDYEVGLVTCGIILALSKISPSVFDEVRRSFLGMCEESWNARNYSGGAGGGMNRAAAIIGKNGTSNTNSTSCSSTNNNGNFQGYLTARKAAELLKSRLIPAFKLEQGTSSATTGAFNSFYQNSSDGEGGSEAVQRGEQILAFLHSLSSTTVVDSTELLAALAIWCTEDMRAEEIDFNLIDVPVLFERVAKIAFLELRKSASNAGSKPFALPTAIYASTADEELGIRIPIRALVDKRSKGNVGRQFSRYCRLNFDVFVKEFPKRELHFKEFCHAVLKHGGSGRTVFAYKNGREAKKYDPYATYDLDGSTLISSVRQFFARNGPKEILNNALNFDFSTNITNCATMTVAAKNKLTHFVENSDFFNEDEEFSPVRAARVGSDEFVEGAGDRVAASSSSSASASVSVNHEDTIYSTVAGGSPAKLSPMLYSNSGPAGGRLS